MQLCFSQDVRLLCTTFDRTLTYYHWQELHATLIRLFKGKIGQSYVEQHNYNISTEDGTSMVESKNWGAVVKKGTILIMSIVMKVALEQKERKMNVCPSCDKTDVGVMRDDGWLQWYA